jgi:hypothetical protein
MPLQYLPSQIGTIAHSLPERLVLIDPPIRSASNDTPFNAGSSEMFELAPMLQTSF